MTQERDRYKRKRHFLMLELMLGIFLICLCMLPLARLPMQALNEEIKSAYRIQLHRFADLAFAQMQEKLYKQEISWKQISSPSKNPAILIDDVMTISCEPLGGTRKCNRKVKIHSVGKKNQNGEEWRLVTIKVEFNPIKKTPFFNKTPSKPVFTFTYKVLVTSKL